jgi:hypothetical protein
MVRERTARRGVVQHDSMKWCAAAPALNASHEILIRYLLNCVAGVLMSRWERDFNMTGESPRIPKRKAA